MSAYGAKLSKRKQYLSSFLLNNLGPMKTDPHAPITLFESKNNFLYSFCHLVQIFIAGSHLSLISD